MSVAPGSSWSSAALRGAVASLRHAALARPRGGIDLEDALGLLPGYSAGEVRDLLGLAEEVRALLPASRMSIDEAGAVSSEVRYFAMGAPR